MLATGPEIATIILSNAVTGGNAARSCRLSPSTASIGANWGSATNPPAGIHPRLYSTPPIVFFQIGLPNQMPNFSTTSPRQRAARK